MYRFVPDIKMTYVADNLILNIMKTGKNGLLVNNLEAFLLYKIYITQKLCVKYFSPKNLVFEEKNCFSGGFYCNATIVHMYCCSTLQQLLLCTAVHTR